MLLWVCVPLLTVFYYVYLSHLPLISIVLWYIFLSVNFPFIIVSIDRYPSEMCHNISPLEENKHLISLKTTRLMRIHCPFLTRISKLPISVHILLTAIQPQITWYTGSRSLFLIRWLAFLLSFPWDIKTNNFWPVLSVALPQIAW